MDHPFQGNTYEAKAPHALALAPRYTLAVPFGIRLKTWLPSLLLMPLCVYFLLKRGDGLFLDPLTVLIHEAGHLCFFFLGKIRSYFRTTPTTSRRLR